MQICCRASMSRTVQSARTSWNRVDVHLELISFHALKLHLEEYVCKLARERNFESLCSNSCWATAEEIKNMQPRPWSLHSTLVKPYPERLGSCFEYVNNLWDRLTTLECTDWFSQNRLTFDQFRIEFRCMESYCLWSNWSPVTLHGIVLRLIKLESNHVVCIRITCGQGGIERRVWHRLTTLLGNLKSFHAFISILQNVSLR